MKILSFLLLGALLSSCLGKKNPPPMNKLQKEDFKSLVSSTSCEGKESCILIYVAPWCSACEAMTPYFQAWQERSVEDPETGVKIIVGKGRTPEENERMAQRFGKDCVVDKGNIHDLLKIDKYPTLLMVGHDGIISRRDQDVIKWAVKRFNSRP